MSDDTLVTSKAQQPYWAEGGHAESRPSGEFEDATAYLDRGGERNRWRHFGSFDGATAYLGSGWDTMNCKLWQFATAELGRRGGPIKSDTSVISMAQRPTSAEESPVFCPTVRISLWGVVLFRCRS